MSGLPKEHESIGSESGGQDQAKDALKVITPPFKICSYANECTLLRETGRSR